VPTETRPDTDPQRYLLSTVRQSQAAVIDAIRTWTTVTEQLTRSLRLPVPDVDFGGAVDRVFDVAEQTLAVQRQLALTVAGVATRQVDTALETVDTAVAAVETTVGKGVRRVEDLVEAAQAEQEQRDHRKQRSAKHDAAKQEPTPDRRTYEERTLEELRERAGELQIEGRSTMSKDELIAALRQHSK
jgi:polyhydroxyalkanoate synthesis regulator phasin